VDARNWEHFEHEADIGLAATSDSRERLFEAMGAALSAVITDPAIVRPRQRVRIRCSAPDNALLMVDWINALIYEMATRGMIFGRFAVTIEDSRLSAKAWGEAVDVGRHHPAAEVKGATYTALRVSRQDDGEWLAQCVIDV